jgi:GNAT superfamily N-acetyltransferase
MTIRLAGAADFDEIRNMLREYAQWLGTDLSFQDFEAELAGLPGDYCAILIAEGAGCVAIRPLASEICEMKRLYVRPASRGEGLGRRLAEAAIAEARNLGFLRMRLDTLPQQGAAHELYRSLGFQEIAPYRFNPVPGARFLEFDLTTALPS